MMTKMMMETGVRTAWAVAVRAQMMEMGRVHLWPWSSSRSESSSHLSF